MFSNWYKVEKYQRIMEWAEHLPCSNEQKQGRVWYTIFEKLILGTWYQSMYKIAAYFSKSNVAVEVKNSYFL